jgi:hypothetical protein
MTDTVAILEATVRFKAQHGLADLSDDQVALALHLMNAHGLDANGALDQTSTNSEDHGIGAWAYVEEDQELHILHGRLTESKATAVLGFQALVKAWNYFGALLAKEVALDNSMSRAIQNLRRLLASGQEWRNVNLALLTPYSRNEIQASIEFTYAGGKIAATPLFRSIHRKRGRVELRALEFVFEGGGVAVLRSYEIESGPAGHVSLQGDSELRIKLVSLLSLVELLRRRGALVFDKNVRLYLNTKENRTRLEHPMEETLESICSGSLDASVFPAYHGGVTISAAGCSGEDGRIRVESPNIINGCQTVTIADRYLSKLEKAERQDAIARFAKIQVIAKIVVRPNDDQLREIANCNNRQNPVEPWQLFCNDPIHVEIEMALQEVGVFYERQKGKFASESRVRIAAKYANTNGTVIEVLALAQHIALCRGQLSLAAKPSEIFGNKEQHDAIFNAAIPQHPQDIVWAANCHKAAKRALQNYLKLAKYQESEAAERVFSKPIVRSAAHYLCMLSFAQKKLAISGSFAQKLNKKAPAILVAEAESFYRFVVAKILTWYEDESNGLQREVTIRKVERMIVDRAGESGLEPNGPMPLTERHMDWTAYVTE